jgi:hypothetical protein
MRQDKNWNFGENSKNRLKESTDRGWNAYLGLWQPVILTRSKLACNSRRTFGDLYGALFDLAHTTVRDEIAKQLADSSRPHITVRLILLPALTYNPTKCDPEVRV